VPHAAQFPRCRRESRAYAGGDTEGWDAPALNSGSPAPVAWTADQLSTLPTYRLAGAARRVRRADGIR
jgi:hypothetical protein